MSEETDINGDSTAGTTHFIGKTRMADFIQIAACPICESRDWTVLVAAKQLDEERKFSENLFRRYFTPTSREEMFKDHIYFTHSYEAALRRCNGCGHLWRTPCLSPSASLRAFSDDHYDPTWMEDTYNSYYADYVGLMPILTKQMGSNLTILEIGSQLGGFLTAANDSGWKASGVDVGREMVAFSRQRGCRVFEGTIEEARYADHQFDCVFVWLCFEMLPYPKETLMEIGRILKPGGSLRISVPNGEFVHCIQPFFSFPLSVAFERLIRSILSFGILAGFPFQFGYTPRSMTNLLSSCGFWEIEVRNQLYIPISGRLGLTQSGVRCKSRLLKCAFYLADLLYYCSFRRLLLAPWIEVTCRVS